MKGWRIEASTSIWSNYNNWHHSWDHRYLYHEVNEK